MSSIVVSVIGSLNVDFVTRVSQLPLAGETLTANSFDTGLGGKGFNQALACARLSGQSTQTCMVGNVGDDSFGHQCMRALEDEHISTKFMKQIPGQKTGIANIIVEEATGENRIMLATNANHAFSTQEDHTWNLVPDKTDVAVFQLEIPMQVLHNMSKARQMNSRVVFNPAPALPLPSNAYHDIDTLIMNETEARILGNDLALPSINDCSSNDLPAHFLKLGVRDSVIITLGARGVIYATAAGETGALPAQKVSVVDTTAAGDTFLGAFVAFQAEHGTTSPGIAKALEFATSAAAKAVGRKGAMASIPYRRELIE